MTKREESVRRGAEVASSVARNGNEWPVNPADGDDLDDLVDEPATDGRVARGQRTRRKVAEALVDLLREGGPDPTAKTIAERAGVSLRLVFHHFTDIDDLYRAVATLQLERHWGDLPRFPATMPLATRIERLVRQRSILYEEISPVRRAAMRRASGSADVVGFIAYTDRLLKENLAAGFAPELSALSPHEHSDLLIALDAVSSWGTWEHLRRSAESTVAVARRVMAQTMGALLSGHD
jgi:AcrR family transcriptional regulator